MGRSYSTIRNRMTWMFLFLFAQPLIGKDRPLWVDDPPREDSTGNYLMYVGRASNVVGESDAFAAATEDGNYTAITQNFGFRTKVQRDSYQSQDKETSTKRILEASKDVEIHDFQVVDSYKEIGDDGKVSVWILFKYSKSAIAAEKLRLSQVKSEENAEVKFNETGSATDKTKGTLEVITHPKETEGAEVSIDNIPIPFLGTPLRFHGLPRGKHEIRIGHSKFLPVVENIIVTPNGTVKVEKILTRAFGKVKITTSPATGANVIVAGKPVGISPTEEISVPAGEKIRIEISHPQFEPSSQTIEVEQDEVRELNIPMVFKPAFIVSVISSPKAILTINGRSYGVTPLARPVRVQAGSVSIQLEKEGFETFSETYSIDGGERKAIPAIKLVTIDQAARRAKEEKKKKEEEAEQEKRNAFIAKLQDGDYGHYEPPSSSANSRQQWFGLRAGYSGDTMKDQSNGSGSLGIYYAYQLLSWLAVEGVFDLGGRIDTYKNGELTTIKLYLQAGIPLSVFRWSEGASRFFIEPGLFYLDNAYSFGPGSGQPSTSSSSLSQYGWLGLAGFDFFTGMAGPSPTALRITAGMGSPLPVKGITSSRFFICQFGFAWGFGGTK